MSARRRTRPSHLHLAPASGVTPRHPAAAANQPGAATRPRAHFPTARARHAQIRPEPGRAGPRLADRRQGARTPPEVPRHRARCSHRPPGLRRRPRTLAVPSPEPSSALTEFAKPRPGRSPLPPRLPSHGSAPTRYLLRCSCHHGLPAPPLCRIRPPEPIPAPDPRSRRLVLPIPVLLRRFPSPPRRLPPECRSPEPFSTGDPCPVPVREEDDERPLVGCLPLARAGRLPLQGPASPAPKAQGEQPPIFPLMGFMIQIQPVDVFFSGSVNLSIYPETAVLQKRPSCSCI